MNSQKKLLGVFVSPGVTTPNMLTFYLTCVATILLGTFINAVQPFLFAEMMNIPQSEHGSVAGKLNFAGEIAIIATVSLWGAISDKIGRRLVITIGFVLVAVSFYLYPRAESVNELLIYRCIYGVGIAAATCMIVALLADYTKDVSRGKAAGLQGVCNGIGAMVALFVLLKLPQIFISGGADSMEAGFRTFDVAIFIAIALALLSFIGLKKGLANDSAAGPALTTMLANGIKAAKDPGIRLAYGAAFVSRANLTIVGAFMTLWISNYGTSEAGMTAGDALTKAGMYVGMAQGVALLGAPVFGILTDKINRVSALLIALVLTFFGYCGTYLINDPFGGAMIVVVILIGLSEIGGIITSGVLIAQQTPSKTRGAVFGIFNLCGAIGILVSSVIGGYLFDHWDQSGPFVFVGFCGLLVAIYGFSVRNKIVKPDHNDEQQNLDESAEISQPV